MKINDLLDYKIMLVTTGAAFNFYSTLLDKEFVGINYHKYLKWADIEASTEDMISNIATILMDENFYHTYLKYAN